jgi:hypothetical protein
VLEPQIGNIGGASLDGSTAYDWKCITNSGTHVDISMDDVCAWGYLTNEGAFSQMESLSDPYSWKCYAS